MEVIVEQPLASPGSAKYLEEEKFWVDTTNQNHIKVNFDYTNNKDF